MAKSTRVTRPADPVLTELVTIKRLLVFALLKSGASQAQVAAALGVAQSQISRMFPNGIGDFSTGRRSR
jgi:predicted XRE-type DNA-binding protein